MQGLALRCGLLLYRRCTDGINNAQSSESQVVNTVGAKLVLGPFDVLGIWGIMINTFAMMYMTIAVVFSFWPPRWVGKGKTAFGPYLYLSYLTINLFPSRTKRQH